MSYRDSANRNIQKISLDFHQKRFCLKRKQIVSIKVRKSSFYFFTVVTMGKPHLTPGTEAPRSGQYQQV